LFALALCLPFILPVNGHESGNSNCFGSLALFVSS
jgi:hypothetical protein